MGSWCVLPDANICKNRHVFENIYECQIVKDGAILCSYSISFGHRHYCRHPDRSVFAVIDNDVDTIDELQS